MISGEVVSSTVIATSSVSAPPLPSSTVRVMVWVPSASATVGVGPVAVPKGGLDLPLTWN